MPTCVSRQPTPATTDCEVGRGSLAAVSCSLRNIGISAGTVQVEQSKPAGARLSQPQQCASSTTVKFWASANVGRWRVAAAETAALRQWQSNEGFDEREVLGK